MALTAEDAFAIQQLYASYNHFVDGGRAEEWADLFVDDGTLDTGLGIEVEGTRAARIEFASSVPAMMPGSRHVATNLLVDGDGSTATGAAYLNVWAADAEAGGQKLLVSGIYRDELRKVDGAWKFARRVLVPDAGGPVA